MKKINNFNFTLWEFVSGKTEDLKSLLRQDNNVIIVRSFLNGREVEKFSGYGKTLFQDNPGLPLLPRSFYNVHRLLHGNNDTAGYYSEVAEFARNNTAYSSLNLQILDFFESSGFKLMNKSDHRLSKIPASTYRIIKKDFAPIHSHCEKYLLSLYPFCKKILADCNVDTDIHYSYFVQLTNPQKGGELVLLKTGWNETKKKNDFLTETLVSEEGIATDLKDIEKYPLRLNPGDLLIFDGGNIWHAISPIESDDERITFGGFINPSREDANSFFIWS
ncbi:MAG TPA: hypothetical protein VNJ07_05940 [Chitinophagales bacterium]|nr:hypothetical protein [Chitinophagales bacterium]